jgi:hypothetical protein
MVKHAKVNCTSADGGWLSVTFGGADILYAGDTYWNGTPVE